MLLASFGSPPCMCAGYACVCEWVYLCGKDVHCMRGPRLTSRVTSNHPALYSWRQDLSFGPRAQRRLVWLASMSQGSPLPPLATPPKYRHDGQWALGMQSPGSLNGSESGALSTHPSPQLTFERLCALTSSRGPTLRC